jgi:hypothetical protein
VVQWEGRTLRLSRVSVRTSGTVSLISHDLLPKSVHIFFSIFLLDVFHWLQCSKSVTFWYGSGSGSIDHYLLITDLAPDFALFVSDLQNANKIFLFFFYVFGYYFSKLHLHASDRTSGSK